MLKESFEQAVDNIAKYGDTDIFPFPVENHLFHDKRSEAVDLLLETHRTFTESLNTNSSPGEKAMAPSGYSGFRWATQLDPLWNAYLLGLVVEISPLAEAARLSKDVVHSHRLAPVESRPDLFTTDAYIAYDTASLASSQDFNWVVVTDIADFYPRIYHHRIDNAIDDIGDKSDVPSKIMELLGVFSKTTSYGLPVGGPASRTLSELVLNRTDKLLNSAGIKFHRYADDYRLFADTKEEAHRVLVELSQLLLRNEGLALSKSKTRVLSSAEFQSTLAILDDDDDQDSSTKASRRRRARELLGLTLRFDPYSPTAEDDFEALKEAVERIDIVDLFMVELSKPRIDSKLTRRLLRALKAAEPAAKAQICTSLAQSLDVLAPLIPQVLQAMRGALVDVEAELAAEARQVISDLISARSYLFELGVNRSFAIRILADDPEKRFENQLIQLYDSAAPFEQRDIVIALARWRARYWLSDKKHQYANLHPWVKRSFLMSSFYLGDEGKHWRDSVKRSLTPFDGLVREWVSSKKSGDPNWELPL